VRGDIDIFKTDQSTLLDAKEIFEPNRSYSFIAPRD